jgi:hypothetical protein
MWTGWHGPCTDNEAQSALPGVRQRQRPQVFSSIELEPLGPDLFPKPPIPRGRDRFIQPRGALNFSLNHFSRHRAAVS